MNKMLKVLKNNSVVIIFFISFLLSCIVIKNNYMDIVNNLDSGVSKFFATKIVSENGIKFMKDITYLGSTVSVTLVFLLCLFIFKNKIIKIVMSLDLAVLLFLRWALKSAFKRPRPEYALINIQKDFSFPSGHTLFAVGFYGLIIYFMWKSNIKKLYKYLLTFVISTAILFIIISRIYLNVHYFTDVLAGFILGILSIILFIGVYKNSDWKWIK